MKKYTYYPGCSLEISNKPYDESTKELFKALGLQLEEVPDWNCCGATMYMSFDEHKAVYLAARNLAIAEKTGYDMAVPCSACFTVLQKAKKFLKAEEGLEEKINSMLKEEGLAYSGKVKIRNILEIIYNNIGADIKSSVKRNLKDIKVACYYGCQLVRPKGTFDDTENPEKLDKLMSWCGASPVFFDAKTKCCGGMLMTTKEDVAMKLVRDILSAAKQAGADCLVTACPLCQINLEGYQAAISRKFKEKLDIPILYFTQLAGYALGIDEKRLGIKENFTDSKKTLAKAGGN